MGLIRVTKQGALPEIKGDGVLVDTSVGSLFQMGSAGVFELAKLTFTYTATTGNLPTNQEIFDQWAPVVGAAYGASGPAITAPTIVASNGDILYPAVTM